MEGGGGLVEGRGRMDGEMEGIAIFLDIPATSQLYFFSTKLGLIEYTIRGEEGSGMVML